MSKIWTVLFLVVFLVNAVYGDLMNPGFETAGSTNTTAQYWEWDNPSGWTQGGYWGNATREDWRSHSGDYEAVIKGTWAGQGDNGGMWQEFAATEGQQLEASAWFWADNNWSAALQGIKIEFYDNSVSLITSVSNAFSDVAESWIQKSVTATAPAETAWVRTAIWADEAGSDGALQFDDVAMSVIPEPSSVLLGLLGATLLYFRRITQRK